MDKSLPMPAELRAELDRIKRAISPGDGSDKEDLITYAREVVALRGQLGSKN